MGSSSSNASDTIWMSFYHLIDLDKILIILPGLIESMARELPANSHLIKASAPRRKSALLIKLASAANTV